MKIIDPAQDAWHDATDDGSQAPAPRRLFTLGQWQVVRETWPRGVAAGLRLDNTVDVESLREDLARMALVTLEFPKWVDGRAYSQARTLRARLQFAGEIRATGDVVVDMMPLLQRTGFDAALLRAGQDPATAERALEFFSEYYQGDVDEPRPWFARTEDTRPAEHRAG
ncbi:MAG TPA: DUF934 domain-containing protein [Burkholderiaceae bacterium]|jgi:uncharacterized protein (DUF934 family)|nr:DUF934 domain-containing protein [Burkholderiaceae bacterium]